MLNVGILGSTKGSDLPAVIESIEKGELKNLATIAIIISDRKGAGILEKAKSYGIQYYRVAPSAFTERVVLDKHIARILDESDVELIVLIGYMRLFSERFVEQYQNRIMNIHPSLLPSFPGMDRAVHQEVLNHGCKVSGCTLFFVEEGKDTGPIILQKAVPVLENDTVDTLKARVQQAEQKILPHGMRLYAQNRLKVEGRIVRILE